MKFFGVTRDFTKNCITFFLTSVFLIAPPAQAGVCDAAFMHDNGALELTGSGALNLGATLAFTEVAKSNGNNCKARVQGAASFSFAGLPAGKTQLDYLMTVKSGQAIFVKYASAGAVSPSENPFDLRILGLFAYDKITGVGQRLPGASFRLKIGEAAAVANTPDFKVRIGEKTVDQKSARYRAR